MAGIFDRLNTDDNVPVHLLTSVVVLVAKGYFTPAQALAALNAQIGTPLDAAAQSDLVAIKDQAIAQSDNGARAVYMHIVESACIAVEVGSLTNEATWRTILEIS